MRIDKLNIILNKIKIKNLEVERDNVFRFDYKEDRFRINCDCGLVERVYDGMLHSDEIAYKLGKKLGFEK